MASACLFKTTNKLLSRILRLPALRVSMMSGEAKANGHNIVRVGVLGPFGTYSHEAAHKYFGDSVKYEEVETINGVFDALAVGKFDFGVVPQENTIFGSVIETYDALRCVDNTFVRGELSLRIDHCLLAKSGVKLKDIRRVFSHEQALGQCAEFIERHLPHASTEKTTSTAAAARMLLDRPPDCAAISSRVCARLFDGLEVLKEAIQKEKLNYTRFYVLARNSSVQSPSPCPNTSTRTALFRVLNSAPKDSNRSQANIGTVINRLDSLQVTRIDRRPSPGDVPFRDLYFVEVQSPTEERIPSDTEWKELLRTFTENVRASGMDTSLIGDW